MNDTPNGGPAFPTTPHYQKDGETQHFYAGHYGMSLRDYFAAQALTGIISGRETWPPDYSVPARCAYELADAMIAERERAK